MRQTESEPAHTLADIQQQTDESDECSNAQLAPKDQDRSGRKHQQLPEGRTEGGRAAHQPRLKTLVGGHAAQLFELLAHAMAHERFEPKDPNHGSA